MKKQLTAYEYAIKYKIAYSTVIMYIKKGYVFAIKKGKSWVAADKAPVFPFKPVATNAHKKHTNHIKLGDKLPKEIFTRGYVVVNDIVAHLGVSRSSVCTKLKRFEMDVFIVNGNAKAIKIEEYLKNIDNFRVKVWVSVRKRQTKDYITDNLNTLQAANIKM